MPPRGSEEEQQGGGPLLSSSKERSLSSGSCGSLMEQVGMEKLEPIFQSTDPQHAELLSTLRRLFEKAERLTDKISRSPSNSATLKACNLSARLSVSLLLDQVALLLENRAANNETFNATVVVSSVGNTEHFLDTIERVATQPSNEIIEDQLNQLLESKDQDETRLRLSAWSRDLAFEFRTGNTDVRILEESGSNDTLPLSVYVDPIVYIREAEMLNRNDAIKSHKGCQVKIDYVSHKKVANTASSAVIGEAIIRVQISPNIDFQEKRLAVWGKDEDCQKMRVVEARA
jgi:hypothetical protein